MIDVILTITQMHSNKLVCKKYISFWQLSGKDSNDLIIVLVTAKDAEDGIKILGYNFLIRLVSSFYLKTKLSWIQFKK